MREIDKIGDVYIPARTFDYYNIMDPAEIQVEIIRCKDMVALQKKKQELLKLLQAVGFKEENIHIVEKP